MPFQIKSLIHTIFILSLLVGAQLVQANSGKAFSIKGKVTINDERLTLATQIKEGDVIKTGADSAVKVIMKDGTVLDILENSGFKITKYAYNKEAPEDSQSSFSILGGAFRYISGLIAKKDPTKVQLSAGTATIGIRGTFVSVNYTGLTTQEQAKEAINNASKTVDSAPTTLVVKSSIGTAQIRFADGTTLNVATGTSGTANLSTGATTVNANPASDPIAAAAAAIANDPTAAAAALEGMSDAQAALVMATLINNASALGATTAGITAALGNAVAANPNLATGLAYVASAVSPSNAAAFAGAIATAAPEQAAAIAEASSQGEELAPAPTIGTDGGSDFPLRTEIDIEGQDEVGDEVTTGSDSGTPLTTEQTAEILNSQS